MAGTSMLKKWIEQLRAVPGSLVIGCCCVVAAVSLAGCGDASEPSADPPGISEAPASGDGSTIVADSPDADSDTGTDASPSADTDQNTGAGAVPATDTDAASGPADAKTVALRHMIDTDVAAVIAHPSRVVSSSLLAPLPLDGPLEEIQRSTGYPLAEIETVVFLMSAPGPETASKDDLPTVITRFNKPVTTHEFLSKQFHFSDPEFEDVELNGKTYVREVPDADEPEFEALPPGDEPEDGAETVDGSDSDFPEDDFGQPAPRIMSTHSIDDRTLILCTEVKMKKILTSGGVETPVGQMLTDATDDADLLIVGTMKDRPDLQQMVSMGAQMAAEGPLQQFSDVPGQLESAMIAVGLNTESLIHVRLTSISGDASAAVFESASSGQEMLSQFYTQFKDSPMAAQAPPQIISMADRLLAGFSVKQDGTSVDLKIANPGGLEELVESLRPALEAAQAAAIKAQQANQMRYISIAMHNYSDVFGSFPPGDEIHVDEDGNMKISWRVHLLPYMDESPLAQKFRLDEAWDTDSHKALIESIPEILQGAGSEPGATRLLAFTGPGTLFESGKEHSFSSVTDGTSATLMFIEVAADKAMPWTQPTDIPITTEDLTSALGDPGLNGYRAVMLDGRLVTLKRDITDATLRAIISPAGGEIVDQADYLAE